MGRRKNQRWRYGNAKNAEVSSQFTAITCLIYQEFKRVDCLPEPHLSAQAQNP